MEITSTPFRITALAAAFSFLFISVGLPANNPIPGIDVVVRKQPGGTAIKTSTDKSGKATARKLAPGRYAMSVRLTAEIIRQLARPATEGTPATPGSPGIPGTPATTAEVAVKITANGRTIEAKSIPVDSTTKAGLVDLRTKSGKQIVIVIKKDGEKKIVALLLPAVQQARE